MWYPVLCGYISNSQIRTVFSVSSLLSQFDKELFTLNLYFIQQEVYHTWRCCLSNNEASRRLRPWVNLPKLALGFNSQEMIPILASVLCSQERRFIRKSLSYWWISDLQSICSILSFLIVLLHWPPTLVVRKAAFPHHENRIALTF